MAGKTIPLLQFAIEGNFIGVSNELAKGVSVDTRNPTNNYTPLMAAVATAKPNLKLVKLLIHHGANVNASAKQVSPIMDDIAGLLEGNAELLPGNPNTAAMKDLLKLHRNSVPLVDNVLSLAINAGDRETIEALLDAGADIQYMRPSGYDALIDAMIGRMVANDSQLVPVVQLLISRGAKLNTVSNYSESALSIASYNGRFDAVRVLLDAGADPGPLQWTPLMHIVVFGSLDELDQHLKNKSNLTARDFWQRTPWLLSLQVGDVAKAKLLLAAGANRLDRGRCGKTPLTYPIINGHTEMLRWLLSEGFDLNEMNDFYGTPLKTAAEMGATECVKILIDAGADIYRGKRSEIPIKVASNLDIIQLLVKNGADINEISDEMRALLTHLSVDGEVDVSSDDYQAGKHRRFGQTNPERMNIPFWHTMVVSGATVYAARDRFDDIEMTDEPVWSFKRFGKSINILPDGRIIEIAGEHEDYYDPDFCIYNDVFVHSEDGTFDIFGYPKACFPPTDFHTATHIGAFIYIIGNLGYQGERLYGQTPVYRLNLESFEIQEVITTGEKPGWIHGHKANTCDATLIRVSGGEVSVLENGTEQLKNNTGEYILDLSTMVWRQIA